MLYLEDVLLHVVLDFILSINKHAIVTQMHAVIFLHLQFIFLTNLTIPIGDKILYLLPIFFVDFY